MSDQISYRSKKSSAKLKAAKAKVSAKIGSRLILARAPKEVAPLVVMLAKKKKAGEDVGKLVDMCVAILA